MFSKIREFISIQLSRKPRSVVLCAILLLNVVFIAASSVAISLLSVSGTEDMNFWSAAYYTIMMVLDAGNVATVVGEVGRAGLALIIVCLMIVIIGMVLFTGAVIGYLTNYISVFIENANLGNHKLHISNHYVIINWNSRASEIVNDLLYCNARKKIVILVPDNKEAIEREIYERLSETIAQERAEGVRLKNKLVIIVREGDSFSTKHLQDISIERASTIIILGSDVGASTCKYELVSKLESKEHGNPQVVKTLVQVSELTGAESSNENQNIVVEVEDAWTLNLVEKIIENKEVKGKCRIVPVAVNKILGRLLAQFSLMPELNLVYRDLFSNKGATFYAVPCEKTDEDEWVKNFFKCHLSAIPLTTMNEEEGSFAFLSAGEIGDCYRTDEVTVSGIKPSINRDYWLEKKNVIILGHNSNIRDIMDGFDSFRQEWNRGDEEIMNILVIDNKANLEKMDYYRAYPYVLKTVEAEVYEKDKICRTIDAFVDENETDTSVLILSDDMVPGADVDSGALANLIYVRDVINNKKKANPEFDEGKIDIVVEIINPKHFDVIKSYSVNNVVISNRYISKMVAQLGEKDALYDFYQDILSYDSEGKRESKEIYIKKAYRYFDSIPERCTVAELIRGVYDATSDHRLPAEQRTNTVILGYVTKKGEITLFSGDQSKNVIELEETDKLIIFANH